MKQTHLNQYDIVSTNTTLYHRQNKYDKQLLPSPPAVKKTYLDQYTSVNINKNNYHCEHEHKYRITGVTAGARHKLAIWRDRYPAPELELLVLRRFLRVGIGAYSGINAPRVIYYRQHGETLKERVTDDRLDHRTTENILNVQRGGHRRHHRSQARVRNLAGSAPSPYQCPSYGLRGTALENDPTRKTLWHAAIVGQREISIPRHISHRLRIHSKKGSSASSLGIITLPTQTTHKQGVTCLTTGVRHTLSIWRDWHRLPTSVRVFGLQGSNNRT